MHRYCAFLIVLALLNMVQLSASAQDHPESLLEFLRPNMHIVVFNNHESPTFGIDVYSEEEFAIVQDSLRMDLSALSEKYPVLKERENKIRASWRESLNDKTQEIDVILSVNRTASLCRLLHVGSDYVLVETVGPSPRRRAIAKEFITQIRLDSQLNLNAVLPGNRTRANIAK